MSSYPPPPEPMNPPPPPLRRRGRDRTLSNPVPSSFPETLNRGRPASPRRPSRTWLVLAAILAVAIAILIPTGLGIYNGLQERADYLHRQAVSHFQQALAYEAENYTDLAVAELEIAVKFDPSYGPAAEKLDALKSQNSPNGTATPESITVADQLWRRAQGAVAKEQWSDAIDSLESIRQTDSKYRVGEVEALLVRAYLNGGKQSITDGQIEEARSRFESALALDPNNSEATTLRDRAALYLNGLNALDSTPQTAVTAFQQLYQQDPTFYDVKSQLRNALTQYGDLASTQGAYCVAAREYDQAARLGGSNAVTTKLDQATANCKQAVLTPPTPTATATSTSGGVPSNPETASLGGFSVQVHPDNSNPCEGLGSITGTAHDAQGKPLAGVQIQIYNDQGYRPPPFTTDSNGHYGIVLGKDAGFFHLVASGPNGQPASGVYDLTYPGGLHSGCRWILDWTKNQ